MKIAETTTPEAWLDTHATRPNDPGSVLLHAGSAVFQAPGGGEVQLIKTGIALQARGCRVGLFNPWRDKIADARLIHLFGLHPEFEAVAALAKSAGIGVVISPICWYDPRAQWALAPGWLSGGLAVAKHCMLSHVPPLRHRAWRSRLLRLADAVLPNSRAEADQLHRLLGVRAHRLHVVPNAVDLDDSADFGRSATDAHEYGSGNAWLSDFGDYVLYAGRIEPRKNVLGLIHACRALDLPLVVIGSAPAESESYMHRCREAAAGARVRFTGSLPKGDPRLAAALASARVFALPSWFETPGLATLEAAAVETPVVVTIRGSTREYFGDDVHYCDPADPATIREALAAAWDHPRATRPELAARIRQNWSWNETARMTEAIYDAVAA
ncbi:glycosyltransferase [bacterium]|nr:glycosyltransferase [bacterium]